jgi:RNA polymerase sigma-70 factor (ECF subfamily)
MWRSRPDKRRARLMREAVAHADGLYSFARHLTRDGAEAEDLVQETYARALAAVDQFDDGTDLRAWLFRILRNTFIDLRRRTQRQQTEGGFDTVGGESSPAAPIEPRQLDHIVGRDIQAALATLSDEARMAVLLDLEGFSEAEIAQCLGCAPGTVKSRLFRARAALRERLTGHAD